MSSQDMKFRIRVIMEKDEDGGLFAYCPDLQGVAVEGENIDDLKRNVEDAVKGYIESLLKHDDPIPVGILCPPERESLFSIAVQRFKERFRTTGSQYIQEILYHPRNSQFA